jgi:hypothetical protein
MENEIWKDIFGYERLYQVSNYGRIKSFACKTRDPFIMSQFNHKQGYKRISLTRANHDKTFMVHRLVAEAFIPNPRNKKTVNHIDGDKGNNNVLNIEWATQKENNMHAWSTGLNYTSLKVIKSSCLRAKLDKCQVLSLKRDFVNGLSLKDLSEKYFISKAQACRIVNGKSRNKTLALL